MKRFRITITQDLDVSFEGDAAARAHAEYIVKECTRIFYSEGETKTIGKWTVHGGMVGVTAFEPLDENGRHLPKTKAPEPGPGAESDSNEIY